MSGIPIRGGNRGELVRTRERGKHNRRPAADDVRNLTADREEQPPFLFVVVAVVALSTIEIELIAAHREFVVRRDRIRDDDAAIIDTAVPTFGDAIVQLQLEVAGRTAAP